MEMKNIKDALSEYRKAYSLNKEDEIVNFNTAMSFFGI